MIKQIVIKAAILAGLWQGYIEGHQGMKNVMGFFIWAAFFVSLATFSEASFTRRAQEPQMPAWFQDGWKAVALLILLWGGHFVMGTVWFITWILLGLQEGEIRKIRSKNAV